MTLLFVFFFASILFSFLCSVWEAVLLSITPSFIARKLNEGSNEGKILQEFKKDIDRPLSAILTLNTIAHTVGAIGVGAQAGKIFGTNAFVFLGLHLSYESIIASAMTLAILIFSEIIPKTIGANNWKSLSSFTVQSLRILMIVLAPFVWISQLITRFLKKNKEESVLSRADFSALVNTGAKEGSIKENESIVIQNLLKLNELTVEDIMTPRTVMFTENEGLSCAAFYNKHAVIRFSRIPLTDDKGQVTAVALKDDIQDAIIKGKGEEPLSSLGRKVLFVSDNIKLPEFIETITKSSSHIALINDAYGNIIGLVTLEDAMETLLGLEIMDETDNVADLQKLARKKWEERAQKIGLLK